MSKRPFSSYVIAVSSLVLAALAAAQPIFFGLGDIIETLLWLGLMLCWVWLGYVVPSVEVREERLLIRNPLRVATIGIGAIDEVDTRFALKVSGSFGSISAWAAPAPGRLRHRSHSIEDFKVLGLKSGENLRPGDLPSTISGSLALQIQRAKAAGKLLPQDFAIKPNLLGLSMALIPGILLSLHYLT
jgi:hypothetical protein